MLFENTICGAKYELRNGGFAFYINHTVGTFSHSASHLLAYNGHIYEYNGSGQLMHQEEVHIDYLPDAEYSNVPIYGQYNIVRRVE